MTVNLTGWCFSVYGELGHPLLRREPKRRLGIEPIAARENL